MAGAHKAGTPCSLSVYRADPAVATGSDDSDGATVRDGDTTPNAGSGTKTPAEDFPDGFTGVLALQNLESFDAEMVGNALARVARLICWGEAQRARIMHRMEEVFRDDFHAATGRLEPGMAFSLAASECAVILSIPEMTGQQLLSEAGKLCGPQAATLAGLEEGRFSYSHARVVMDQCEGVPAGQLPGFEADLLNLADGQTRSQFAAKARRLREKTYPETISERHQSAFEKRKVILDREEDGMSCLSAYLRAEHAQQIYTALSSAARGEQVGGDPRTRDQLRADILAQLLMGGLGSVRPGGSGQTDETAQTDGTDQTDGTGDTGRYGVYGTGRDHDSEGKGTAREPGNGGPLPRAEIMVLINAETLFGADEQPAELHGYGPISPEAARRLARRATHWTGLIQDPKTGAILGVGRRRKVPAGLARWLSARDGTCRFPGCRVSTATAEIDHTINWAKGGDTIHGNLAHLCRRHHRYKTLGFWKASQPTPGVIEWTSPTGRAYRTEPFLELAPSHAFDPRTEFGSKRVPVPAPQEAHDKLVRDKPPPF